MAKDTDKELEVSAALEYVDSFLGLNKRDQQIEASKGAVEAERFISKIGSNESKEPVLVIKPPTYLERLRGRAERMVVALAKGWESVAACGVGMVFLSPIYNSDLWWKAGIGFISTGVVLGGVNWVSGRLTPPVD